MALIEQIDYIGHNVRKSPWQAVASCSEAGNTRVIFCQTKYRHIKQNISNYR